jgi:protease-4
MTSQSSKPWWGIALVVGLILISVGLFSLALQLRGGESKMGAAEGKASIGILPLTGVIMDSKDFVERLIAFRDNEDIKAIIIRADSPGGAVGPSQELYAELKKVDEKKPIYTSVGALCASGCYYAAVGTRRIFSNPGSLIGSIGVIMPLYEAEALFEWAKVHPQFIKSAPMKDIGHPSKRLSEAEAAALQSVVDSTHAQFVTAVTEGRMFAGMMTDEVRAVANGLIYTGEQAMGYGMVDEMGTFRDAVAYAAKEAKIEGEPKLVYPREDKPQFFELFLESAARAMGGGVVKGIQQSVENSLAGGRSPATYFLWKPN